MSFASEQYYMSLCDMLFIQINNTSALKGVSKEILMRDYVSRIYYTAFLHCSKSLALNTKNSNSSHDDVIQNLKGEIRTELLHLKSLRKKADYDLNPFPDPLKFKGKTEKLQRLKAVVNDILSMDKASLSA